ncbi:WD40 repeat domain-containing protein [Kitasatospora indigofera]|uniref:WD40 repeat domain-containing protein n=1 Tax=Kitasatospora indigofera TaxID=67307 RepID=UPI0033BCA3EA
MDSPRWRDLDGVSPEELEEVLEAMAASGAAGAGEEWQEPWSRVLGGLLQQETLYSGAFAALPHLVEVAAASPGRFVGLWADLGLMVTAEPAKPVPADLEAGFTAAVRLAARAAVRGYLTAGAPAAECAYLALSCAALAGHRIGEVLWQSLGLDEGSIVLCCPGCESETEIADFFVDPVRPPFEAPGLPDPAAAPPDGHVWGEVAGALADGALGQEWEPFLRVARAVAAAGVPVGTPGRAVLCLVAAMVAVKGTPDWAGKEWARKLMLLTGDFRCPDCEQTWAIADCLVEDPDGARPHDARGRVRTADGWSAPSTAPAPQAGRTGGPGAGLRPEGGVLLAADRTPRGRVKILAGPGPASAPGSGEGVNALAVVSSPAGPTLVAAAGDTGTVFLWDAADGRPVHPPLAAHPSPVRSLTALRPPEGPVVLASGHADGTLVLWDPGTGQPLCEPVANWLGPVEGMCAAAVPDGRTLLVTATPRGAVRLRDPRTGEPVARLNPTGRGIESIAAVPISPGHTLVAASDTQGDVHLWDPAVDDPWEPGAATPPGKRAREDHRHRVALVAAVRAHDRHLVATGDRRGAVMLWDPATGTPVGDGLPPDAPGSLLTAMTATTLPGRRHVLVTGSNSGRSLRVWEPRTGEVQHLALDVAVTCLAAAGPDLVVGHGAGVLTLRLTW